MYVEGAGYPSRAENVFLMPCPRTRRETAPLSTFPFAPRGVRYAQIALPSRARGVPLSLTTPIEPVHLTDVGVTGAPSVLTCTIALTPLPATGFVGVSFAALAETTGAPPPPPPPPDGSSVTRIVREDVLLERFGSVSDDSTIAAWYVYVSGCAAVKSSSTHRWFDLEEATADSRQSSVCSYTFVNGIGRVRAPLKTVAQDDVHFRLHGPEFCGSGNRMAYTKKWRLVTVTVCPLAIGTGWLCDGSDVTAPIPTRRSAACGAEGVLNDARCDRESNRGRNHTRDEQPVHGLRPFPQIVGSVQSLVGCQAVRERGAGLGAAARRHQIPHVCHRSEGWADARSESILAE